MSNKIPPSIKKVMNNPRKINPNFSRLNKPLSSQIKEYIINDNVEKINRAMSPPDSL